MSGSIACFKVCEAISKLRHKYSIKVIMTNSATKFIGNSTIEGLTGNPAYTNTFQDGNALDHISLIREADLVMIAPATANFIAKIANGIGDDLASTTLLAHDFKKKVIIAPAMNTYMWNNPATIDNVNKLKSRQFIFLEPIEGLLACGENGTGKIVNPQDIVDYINHQLRELNHKNILITSGGTQEQIDDVRVLTNKSSGRTGAIIADHLYEQGYNIYYLGSKNGIKPNNKFIKKIDFLSFVELKQKIQDLISTQNFYSIIHSAAVSDFSVIPSVGKLSSEVTPQLNFVKNEKIIDSIRTNSKNKNVVIFGFKLTSQLDTTNQKKAVAKLLNHAPDIDYVIANDIKNISKNNHDFLIFDKLMNQIETGYSKIEMAEKISNILSKK